MGKKIKKTVAIKKSKIKKISIDSKVKYTMDFAGTKRIVIGTVKSISGNNIKIKLNSGGVITALKRLITIV